MSFVAVLFALLLEQARPLGQVNPIHNSMRNWVQWALRNFDTGRTHHGWLVWCVGVVFPAALVCVIHWALVWTLGWVAAGIWSVAVLYATLGFRQFSHHFTAVRDALLAGDEELARQHLAAWMRKDLVALQRSQIVRHVIAYSVIQAHRHVFGVFAWYSLLAGLGLGPMGAVLYRVAEYLGRYANRQLEPMEPTVSSSMQEIASAAWRAIDWLPARLTALSFAFVGSFEEAIDAWRRQEALQPGDSDGVILAATAGAVNVQLDDTPMDADAALPQPAHLRAVVGLVWRTVVMWIVMLALLSLARMLG